MTPSSLRRPLLRTALFILFALVCLTAVSCALPKIIILHDPLTPQEHINLGLSYEKEGDVAQAAEEYRKAAKELPAGYLYLGNLAYGRSEYSDAEKYYRKAIRKDPGLADACNNLAWLLLTRERNLGEAETLALKATELAPSNEAYKDTLARIREKMKQAE